jgi:hypothetical protein
MLIKPSLCVKYQDGGHEVNLKKTNLITVFVILFSWMSATPAQAKLQANVLIGAFGGLGTMGDGATNANRSMSNFGVHAMPALKLGKFLIGPMAQYQFVGQMTDPATVGDVNLGGTGYIVGAGIGFTIKRFLIRASYDFLGSNTGVVAAANGQSSVYQKASGFTGLVSFRLKPTSKVLLDLYVSQHSFKEQSVGGTITDLSSNPMKALLYSAGLTFQLGPMNK